MVVFVVVSIVSLDVECENIPGQGRSLRIYRIVLLQFVWCAVCGVAGAVCGVQCAVFGDDVSL